MSSTNGHGPKRAVLYARVSTEEQAKSGYSLAQQMEALREYARREGYEVLEEVTDPGQSGASLERPGMDRVRELVAAGGVSVVLAQDRDRFAKFERAKIAERARRGLKRKANEGYVSLSTPNYGFRHNEGRDGLVIYEPEMLMVKKILHLVAEGCGMVKIQSHLYAQGVPSPKGAPV